MLEGENYHEADEDQTSTQTDDLVRATARSRRRKSGRECAHELLARHWNHALPRARGVAGEGLQEALDVAIGRRIMWLAAPCEFHEAS